MCVSELNQQVDENLAATLRQEERMKAQRQERVKTLEEQQLDFQFSKMFDNDEIMDPYPDRYSSVQQQRRGLGIDIGNRDEEGSTIFAPYQKSIFLSKLSKAAEARYASLEGSYFKYSPLTPETPNYTEEITLSSRGRYEGQIKNNIPDGKGRLISTDGGIYEGYFSGGLCHGEGRQIFSDGAYYEGHFENDQPQGSGVFIVADDSVRIKGIFKDGLVSKGREDFKDGSYYEGNFKNNIRNGQGKHTFANGDWIKGEFLDGLADGKAIQNTSGWIYEGEFKSGKFNGAGKQTFKNGTVKEGMFKDGVLIDN